MKDAPGPASRLVCAGCGTVAPGPETDPYPFRCSEARPDDDIDHIVRPVLARADGHYPARPESNPFLRYRALFHSYHVAIGHGLSDVDYRALVSRLDDAVARVDGEGFTETPFGRSEPLSRALGFGARAGVWVKDETGNVSGSHKARHLMGVAVYLEVLERLGLQPTPPPRLAIASCGNAALTAAVVARAAGRRLRVFVPPAANPHVLARLQQLGADVTLCPRDTDLPGDPCHLRFRQALGPDVIAFSCQGSDTGLAVEGGETLAWEMTDALPAPAVPTPSAPVDRLFVQVGGGLLASACVLGFQQRGCLPRIHAVQTAGAFPLKRAYDRLVARLLARLRADGLQPPSSDAPAATATFIRDHASASVLDQELAWARHHRGHFMWPWETEPRSIASGILDDETYDWAVVVEGMLRSGGYPLVVGEDQLIAANQLARSTTGVNVDHTGSAGLAGLLEVVALEPHVINEKAAVIFSGVSRPAEAA